MQSQSQGECHFYNLKVFLHREVMRAVPSSRGHHTSPLIFSNSFLEEISFAFQGNVLHEVEGILNGGDLKEEKTLKEQRTFLRN